MFWRRIVPVLFKLAAVTTTTEIRIDKTLPPAFSGLTLGHLKDAFGLVGLTFLPKGLTTEPTNETYTN